MNYVDFDEVYDETPVTVDPIKVIARSGGGRISYAEDGNLIHLLDATDNKGRSHNYLMLPDRQASRIAAAFGAFWPVGH